MAFFYNFQTVFSSSLAVFFLILTLFLRYLWMKKCLVKRLSLVKLAIWVPPQYRHLLQRKKSIIRHFKIKYFGIILTCILWQTRPESKVIHACILQTYQKMLLDVLVIIAKRIVVERRSLLKKEAVCAWRVRMPRVFDATLRNKPWTAVRCQLLVAVHLTFIIHGIKNGDTWIAILMRYLAINGAKV